MKNILNIFFLLLCLQSVFANNDGDETACISFIAGSETVEVELPITYVQSTVIVFAGQTGSNANTPPPYFPNTQNPSRLAYNTTFHVLWGFNGSTWQKIPLSSGTTYTAGAGISIIGTVISNTGDLSNTNECNTAFNVSSGNLRVTDGCGTLTVPLLQIAPIQVLSSGSGITVTNNGIGGYTVTNSGDISNTNECNTDILVRNDSLIVSDLCGDVGLPLSDISTPQLAKNGLRLDADTVKLGGNLIEPTDIYTAHNPFTISDTSVGGLSCKVERTFGFDNYPQGFDTRDLSDVIHTTYKVPNVDTTYYQDVIGQVNCDGSVVRIMDLSVGSDKTFTDFRRGQITNAYTDGVGTVNVLEVTNTNVKAFSAAPSGTTEITASGGAGKIQASDSLYLEGGRVTYLAAPQKLYVQPNNVGTATVGDVLTMVGVNGETEWKPPSDLCTQIQSLPSGTPSGGEKVVYLGGSSVPSGWVGLEFDYPTLFSACSGIGGNIADYYFSDFQTSCGQNIPPSPISVLDVAAVQGYIDSNVIPAVNACNGTSFVAGDIIYTVVGATIVVWYNPLYNPTYNNFVFGDNLGGGCEKQSPSIATSQPTPTSSCFIGDAPTAPAAWLLNGNAGTDGGVTDFLGTIDSVGLVLKTNNTLIAKFGTNQNISLHDGSTASGYMSLATGDVSEAIGDYSISTGQGIAVGKYSFAHCNSVSNGGNSFAANASTSDGDSSFSANNSNAVGNSSSSFNSSVSNGEAAFAANESAANGSRSFAAGFHTIAASFSEATLGANNVAYTPSSLTSWNTNDRLFSIGNGQGLAQNNSLTLWKDGRAVMNTDATNTTPIQNTWFGINGTLTQNFNHIRTPNTLAAFSTEHTPSGNYAVFGSTAGNSGISINNTKQFAFTTTAGTSSTNLGATTTIANYSNSGFLFGGGATATSTLQLQGSYASNALVIAANYVATATDNTLVCNNGATNITVTLPDPTTCLGREYTVLRYAGSTGAITVTNAGTASIQALAGTIGTTTTITALGAHDDWSVKFKAVTVGAVTSWLRID